MIKTDILIIGAGPTGLFAVFEAGLLKLKCHLIDALAEPGGQCSEIYPKKPIYDIPAYPEILAGDLTKKLLEQSKQFEPGFTLGERAETIEKQVDGSFVVTTNKGTQHKKQTKKPMHILQQGRLLISFRDCRRGNPRSREIEAPMRGLRG